MLIYVDIEISRWERDKLEVIGFSHLNDLNVNQASGALGEVHLPILYSCGGGFQWDL